jgi:hypothetical protein
MEKINDKWYIFGIIVLLLYFIYRLIDQSQMISMFPLDFANDWSSYLAQLHFLQDCGFHASCSYWYNGFTSFLISPPGWYFFTYPILLITGSVTSASFISLIIIYILGLFGLLFIGKIEKFSKAQILFFFVAFFGNAITLGNYIRLGRVTAIFAFVLGIWLTYYMIKYKDRKLDAKFLIIIPIYALLIITHYQEAILFSFLLLCLFMVKTWKEKFIIVLSFLGSLILASFWIIPFIKQFFNTSISSQNYSSWGLLFTKELLLTQIISFIVVIAFFIFFYYYIKSNPNQKTNILFYSPLLVLAALFITRATVFIPILQNLHPDPYITFFLFFTLLFFLKIKFKKGLLKSVIIITLILIPLASISMSHFHTPYFTEHSSTEEEILTILDQADGSFLLFIPYMEGSYNNAYYSYAPVAFGLETPSGWYPHIVTEEYLKILDEISVPEEGDCSQFREHLETTQTEQIISFGEVCPKVEACSFEKEFVYKRACLFNVN